MSKLTVAEYDTFEEKAIMTTPIRIIEAFQPVLWNVTGFPSRIKKDCELYKYVDTMHELRFENDFENLLGNLTIEEFGMLQQVTKLILSFSEKNFNRKLIARSSVLRMINVFRHIKYLYGNNRPRIFEVGPGCGYLGGMLLLDNYPYASTDISQAFYLYQNNFLDFISEGKLLEGVHSEINLNKIQEQFNIHIPWWKFVKLNSQSSAEFDLITSNHCLCEMHPQSLAFTLAISRIFLRNKAVPKIFMFEGTGWDFRYTMESVINAFEKFGFSLLHNDSQITILTPKENKICIPQGTISKIISKKRELDKSKKIIKLDEVNDFYMDLIGQKDLLNSDEQFFKLIRFKH